MFFNLILQGIYPGKTFQYGNQNKNFYNILISCIVSVHDGSPGKTGTCGFHPA